MFFIDNNTYRSGTSYDALQTRLAENTFAKKTGVIDYSAPALHLASLTPEELFILLKNLRHVFASGDPEQYLVPDEALEAFLRHCSEKIGDAYFRTPRNTIKAFVDMLAILDQNNNLKWNDMIDSIELHEEKTSDMPGIESATDEGLAGFSL